jgi:hypothetical protein
VPNVATSRRDDTRDHVEGSAAGDNIVNNAAIAAGSGHHIGQGSVTRESACDQRLVGVEFSTHPYRQRSRREKVVTKEWIGHNPVMVIAQHLIRSPPGERLV